MFLVIMRIDGTILFLDTDGHWQVMGWDATGGPVVPNALNITDDMIITQDCLPPDTIDSYLADVTTGLPVLPSWA